MLAIDFCLGLLYHSDLKGHFCPHPSQNLIPLFFSLRLASRLLLTDAQFCPPLFFAPRSLDLYISVYRRRLRKWLSHTSISSPLPSFTTLPASSTRPMSQGSWSPGCSGSVASRVRRDSSDPWTAAAMPLQVVPPPVFDDVTRLPLILCPNCKLCRVIAFTCKWTRNRGKRFFMCPRKDAVRFYSMFIFSFICCHFS